MSEEKSKIDGREATLRVKEFFGEMMGGYMFEVIEISQEEDKWRVTCCLYPIGKAIYEVFVDAQNGRILEAKMKQLQLGVKRFERKGGEEK